MDLDRLNAARADLAAAAETLHTRTSTDASETLQRETRAYLGHLGLMVTLVGSRQLQSAVAASAMTEMQVVGPAIAERVINDPEPLIQALKLVADAEAAGISTFRYRSSRDPADHSGDTLVDFAKVALGSLDGEARIDARAAKVRRGRARDDGDLRRRDARPGARYDRTSGRGGGLEGFSRQAARRRHEVSRRQRSTTARGPIGHAARHLGSANHRPPWKAMALVLGSMLD